MQLGRAGGFGIDLAQMWPMEDDIILLISSKHHEAVLRFCGQLGTR